MEKISETEQAKRIRMYWNMHNKLENAKKNNKRYRDRIRDLETEKDKLERERQEKNDRIAELERRNKELEKELKEIADTKKAKAPKIPDYSVNQYQKHQNKRSKIRGKRTSIEEKNRRVTREEFVYPEGIIPGKCFLARTRIVTRIINGKAEVIRYHIYRESTGGNENGAEGKIDGIFAYSDYGIEVGIIASFLVYELGLSYTQTQKIFSFFCRMEISTSQIDNVLNQLGKSWKESYEAITEMMIYSLVVYLDETGWKIGKERRYTWIFKTLTHTLFLYGKKRSEEVLDEVLPLGKFKGIGVSDCYRMYVNRFDEAQKCWAHFLRKIIRLHLLYPEEKEYKKFLVNLGGIFSQSKKIKTKPWKIKRKNTEVKKLRTWIKKLCNRQDERLNKNTTKQHREFVNLQKSLIRNIDDLFTFVFYKEVEPTNNTAEQGLRKTALMRNNYQTSKTQNGAEKRSIITTVLASLKQNLPEFSLDSVIIEVQDWMTSGKTLFIRQLEAIHD